MRHKVKVLLILEATAGGTRRHLTDLVTNLDKDRFDVWVVCSALREPDFLEDVERMRAAGATVLVIPMVRAPSLKHDLWGICWIRRLLLRERFDLVHTHSSKAGMLGRLAARGIPGLKVIHSPHVFPFVMRSVFPLPRLYLAWEKIAGRLTDHFIAVSQGEKARALAAGVCHDGQITVVVNGMDTDAFIREDRQVQGVTRHGFGISEDDVVVGTVGRLTRQKGHLFLVQAARQLVRQVPNLRFVWVGEGELEAELKRRILHWGLGKHFIFLGYQREVSRFYALFDIYALPSLWEGCPYTALEAMAWSKPVVGADVDGIREIVINGTTGLRVPHEAPSALAEALEILLTDGTKRRQMGQAGRERVVSRFGLDRMVKAVEDVYLQLGGT